MVKGAIMKITPLIACALIGCCASLAMAEETLVATTEKEFKESLLAEKTAPDVMYYVLLPGGTAPSVKESDGKPCLELKGLFIYRVFPVPNGKTQVKVSVAMKSEFDTWSGGIEEAKYRPSLGIRFTAGNKEGFETYTRLQKNGEWTPVGVSASIPPGAKTMVMKTGAPAFYTVSMRDITVSFE